MREGGLLLGLANIVGAAGALHDLTGGWSWPVAVLVAVLVPMTWAGWGAARDAVLQTSEVRADEDIDRLDRLDPSVG